MFPSKAIISAAFIGAASFTSVFSTAEVLNGPPQKFYGHIDPVNCALILGSMAVTPLAIEKLTDKNIYVFTNAAFEEALKRSTVSSKNKKDAKREDRIYVSPQLNTCMKDTKKEVFLGLVGRYEAPFKIGQWWLDSQKFFNARINPTAVRNILIGQHLNI